MRILVTMLKQIAVWWPVTEGLTAFDRFGQPVPATPVEISCRWVDIIEEFVGPDGAPQVSRSKIYVDRDVTTGGYLYLGRLSDLSSADVNPEDIKGAWEIMSFQKLPTLKADKFLRTVFL